MTPQEIAHRIDHTVLKPEAADLQIRRLVAQAVEYQFAAVCINPHWIPLAAELLQTARSNAAAAAGGIPAICACIGFPLGAMFSSSKAAEAAACIRAGATELDMVAFIPALLARNAAQTQDDILQVVVAARQQDPRIVIKVILETALLNESQIATACEAAAKAGADFVKTSTGFHAAGGATVQAVQWLKKHSYGMRVKASGGIRDLPAALAMLEAGADRLGCSAGVEIVTAARA